MAHIIRTIWYGFSNLSTVYRFLSYKNVMNQMSGCKLREIQCAGVKKWMDSYFLPEDRVKLVRFKILVVQDLKSVTLMNSQHNDVINITVTISPKPFGEKNGIEISMWSSLWTRFFLIANLDLLNMKLNSANGLNEMCGIKLDTINRYEGMS